MQIYCVKYSCVKYILKKGSAMEKEMMKLENQLCFPLYAAARSVTGLYTPWLKQLGLTYTQYITFLVLWEKDGITVGEICDRLMLDNGTVSPLLKKMESAGYITRSRSTTCRSAKTAASTSSGPGSPANPCRTNGSA